MIEQVILAIAEIFTIFVIGGFLRHKKILLEQDITRLSKLVVDVLFPLMVFSSITKNFNPKQLNDLWIMPLAGFGIMAFGAVIGIFLKKGLRDKTPEKLATFHHYCAINNYVFLPIIILENLWGETYIPLLLIMTVGSTIGLWTIGVALLGGSHKNVLKNILNMNLAAVVIAITIVMLKIPIPALVTNISTKLGGAAVPLMLLFIGAAIYGTPHLFKNKRDMIYLIFIRLIVLPMIIVGVLKLLHLPENIFRVIFIVSLMPVPVSSAVLTRRFGGDPDFAGQAIIVTTTASIVTIPIMIYLFL